MDLTDEQIEEYVKKSGSRCPYCNPTNVFAVGGIDADGPIGWQDIRCDDCLKEWVDEFRLVGMSEVDDA